MPPRATEPNLIDAGSTEIVAAPGVPCWPEPGLVAPVSPMQPELDRIAKNRRTRAAKEIDFLPAEFPSAAYFRAPPSHFMYLFFIAAIVVCGPRRGLLSQWTFMGQGSEPAPHIQVRREAAGRAPTILRGPSNWIQLNRAPIYGTVAETSFESALSTLLESTEVTT